MMGWPLLIGLAIVCATGVLIRWATVKYARADAIAVQRKTRMLSVSERKLFGSLVDALSDKYFIFAKVTLRDFIELSPAAKWLNLIQIRRELDTYCVDFILCKQADMSIFAVVELEHAERSVAAKISAKRMRRDKAIRRACDSANLKLFHFDVRPDYTDLDVCRLITGKSKGDRSDEDRRSATHQSQLTIDNSSHSISGYARSCPKCRSEVVTKVSVKGRNIGKKFLMCRKYPYCDYRIAKKDS
jgi:ssDNA-binding Zn-finger/Zn-ribbon topoisomerase 1